ncbi:MAG: hypothetical protein V4813_14880 [Gemmatimonadota bacterium]
MSAKIIATIVASVLGSTVLFGAVALLRPSMLGWAAFVYFALAGIASLFGAVGIARRRTSAAFGVCMLAYALHFGISFGNTGLPQASPLLTTALLLAAVAWFAREARQPNSDGTSAA